MGPSPGRWAARWPAAVDGLGRTPAAPPLSFTTEDRLPPHFQRTCYSSQTHMPHTNCIESEWTSYSPKISSHSDQMHYWKTETGSGAPDAKRRFPHATVRRFDGLTVRRFVQRFPVQLLAWACMQKGIRQGSKLGGVTVPHACTRERICASSSALGCISPAAALQTNRAAIVSQDLAMQGTEIHVHLVNTLDRRVGVLLAARN